MKRIVVAALGWVVFHSFLNSEALAELSVDSGASTTVYSPLTLTPVRGAFIDANRIFSYVTNLGSFASDRSGVLNLNGGGGMVFPYAGMANIANGTSNKTAVFAAGLWLGGIDLISGDTLVTVAEFGEEYVPGPMSNGTFLPDDPAFRVYKLYRDSLAENPSLDYLEWPISQGAPVDQDGRPAIRGLQTLWTVFNDADTGAHTNKVGGSEPLGVEVQQTFWSMAGPSGDESNALFVTYRLKNKGKKLLKDFFVSLWIDPDLGGFTDDLVGSDPADDLFYCYNATNNDGVYGSRPPAFAVKLVEGPHVDSPGSTGFVNGRRIRFVENLPLYSFNKHIRGTDPSSPAEAYRYMVGLNGKTGGQIIDPTSGVPTRFFGFGDPVTGVGFLDSNASDRRMMGSVGPFSFNPGATQYVTWKMAFGHGAHRLHSLALARMILNRELDGDNDGIAYYVDNCPNDSNFNQLDTDNDGVGDACDNCIDKFNPAQADSDNDGIGDACLQTSVVINTQPTLPRTFALHQNYPNPFNPSTKITLDLPYRSAWKITIFNVNGQTVEALSGESRAGTLVMEWDASAYATGIYFVKAQAGGFSSARKMMLLK